MRPGVPLPIPDIRLAAQAEKDASVVRSWIVTAVFGGSLIVIGLLMMRSHVREWRKRQADPSLEPADDAHYRRQYRRRMQASSMLVLIGVLLPIGDALLLFVRAPQWLTVFWMLVLLLVLWLSLLALGDLLSTQAHARVALSRIRQRQRALEQQAAALRAQVARPERTNGRGDHGDRSPP
jgi:Flp pilus assembly protein protease CpaA